MFFHFITKCTVNKLPNTTKCVAKKEKLDSRLGICKPSAPLLNHPGIPQPPLLILAAEFNQVAGGVRRGVKDALPADDTAADIFRWEVFDQPTPAIHVASHGTCGSITGSKNCPIRSMTLCNVRPFSASPAFLRKATHCDCFAGLSENREVKAFGMPQGSAVFLRANVFAIAVFNNSKSKSNRSERSQMS